MKYCLRLMLIIALSIFAALATPTAKAQTNTWSFSLTPANGAIMGAPSTTIGWGYEITNSSPTYWLFATDVHASNAFLYGTATSNPFDYPALAPLSSVSVLYDGTSGLADLTWDANAPVGFSNTGNFILSASYYDGDPYNGGQYVADAGTREAAYQATVTSAPVPEASTWQSMGALLLLGGLLAVRRPRVKRN